MALLNVDELSALFDRFDRRIFRLENLDGYDTDHEAVRVAAYLAGENDPGPADASWNKEMAAHVAAGKEWIKIHVLRDPTTEYFRYACEWSWPASSAYGQDVRILDLTQIPQPEGVPDDDFWVIDDTVVLMTYNPAGRFVEADLVDPAAADRYLLAQEIALELSEPFGSWWTRHPEHHRSNWIGQR